MKQFPFSIRSGSQVLEVGSVMADDEKAALAEVAAGKTPLRFRPTPGKWYTVRVGPLTASACGEELTSVAAQTGAGAKDSHGASDWSRQRAVRALGEEMLKTRAARDSYLSDLEARNLLDEISRSLGVPEEMFYGGFPTKPVPVCEHTTCSAEFERDTHKLLGTRCMDCSQYWKPGERDRTPWSLTVKGTPTPPRMAQRAWVPWAILEAP